MAAGRYKEARDAFVKAAADHPSDYEALHGAGVACLYLHEDAEAARLLEKAAALAPAPDRALSYNYAVADVNRHDYRRAAQTLRDYLYANPNTPDEPLLDALGAAVARHWGLGDELLQMIRRQPLDAAVHPPRSDADTLRLTCSFANELVDALGLPEARRRPGVDAATRRYAKALGVGLREVMEALNPGAHKPPAAPVADAPAAGGGSLRERLSARGGS